MDIKNIARKIACNKKAVLFSLISVLFSILFVTIFTQSFSTTLSDKIPASNIRIKVMDTYTRNFESYAGSSVKISTYRILESMTQNRKNSGFYADFNNFNQTFHDCMVCGQFQCGVGPQCPSGDSGYDLKSRLDNIVSLSLSQLNIKTVYKINSVDIAQGYPFQVDVTVNISYNVTDNSGGYYASWTRSSIIQQSVPIASLTDPLEYINSRGGYQVPVIQYTGPCQFNESCWSFQNTQAFYESQQFRYYPNGTSFLQRYMNDTSPSNCCGIEHIMNATSIPGANVMGSFIDRLYWNSAYQCNNNPGDIKILNITLDSIGVSLDELTSSRYGVGSSGAQICPK